MRQRRRPSKQAIRYLNVRAHAPSNVVSVSVESFEEAGTRMKQDSHTDRYRSIRASPIGEAVWEVRNAVWRRASPHAPAVSPLCEAPRTSSNVHGHQVRFSISKLLS